MLNMVLVFVWSIFIISSVSTCGSKVNNKSGDKYNFIDLTLPFENSTFGYEKSIEIENMEIQRSEGTHIEAPIDKGHTMYVTDLPTQELIVQLIIINISSRVKSDPKHILDVKDFNYSLSSSALHHISLNPSLVVFRFGWSQYYFNDPTKYFGYEKEDAIDLPAIGADVVKWLKTCETCKNVVGVGTDLPSLNVKENNDSTLTNQTLTKEGFYVIEGLNLNHSLPSYQCIAVVTSMKIKEPKALANVIAICPENDTRSPKDNKEHKSGKRERKHSNMCKQMTELGVGMCGRHHKNLKDDGASKNAPEHREIDVKDAKHYNNMCKEIMAVAVRCGHDQQNSTVNEAHINSSKLLDTKVIKRHNLCEQIMVIGDSMCGHLNKLTNGRETDTNMPQLKPNIPETIREDKNKTGVVNEIPHQMKENNNNTIENNNEIETKEPETQMSIHTYVTPGNKEVNSANKKPAKAGETENNVPNLSTAPQAIIAGISNIKNKIKEFVSI